MIVGQEPSPADRERVARDARHKAESLERSVADLEAGLLAEAERSCGAAEVEELHGAVRYLDRHVTARGAHEGPNYVRHAVRVASWTLRWRRPRMTDALVIAILHNAFEVCGLSEADLLAAGVSRRVASAVRVLTIERSRDEDLGYLAGFYRAIEAFGDDAALVRCADKIDNLLGLSPSDARQRRYIALAARFAGPIAYRLSDDLGRHFAAVLDLANSGAT